MVDTSFWRDKRVLITGHTGFKGAWLALWLTAAGSDVAGLSLGAPTTPSLHELARVDELVASVGGDVRDPDGVDRAFAAHRPEIVVHMAAQSLVRASFTDPRGTYATNVMGTVNVLDAVRRSADTRVVVVVTTDKCYENREWEWPYREDDPMGGFDPYSSSKGAAELVTSAYRRSFFGGPDAARVASARAGNVIGGGDWAADRLVPDAMRAALAGERIQVRYPDAVRPWQHVLNPLSGYLRLAEAAWEDPSQATAFNFGPSESDVRSVRDVLDGLAARWPGLEWSHDGSEHPHEAGVLKLDSSRARTRLGWSPRWGLDRALDSIVEWTREVRDGGDARDVTLAQIEAFAPIAA